MKTNLRLRLIITSLGITQAEAAHELGISLRQMQSYLADPGQVSTAIEAPPYVALALERLIEKQGKLP
jgi:DNA-binding transcriptional regulator LsrR (DeoR family)